MYQNILIAVEESDYSFRASQEVFNFLGEETKVTIIHAIDPNRVDGELLPSVFNEMKYKQFEERYAQIKEIYDDKDVNYDLLILKGNLVKTIVDEANSGKYDALIIGARGKKGLLSLDLGDVSDKLLKEVTIPIILVK